MLSRPVSATNRAVACPDIILEIIEQVSPPWPFPLDGTPNAQYDRRKSLAALALACKAFNAPATKALWSRLDSFLPLMNVFSAFDGHETDGEVPTYVRRLNLTTCPNSSATDILMKIISGDIPPHEFSRFRELGGFLHAVVPSSCVCEVAATDPVAWHYLSRVSGGKPLFPSLRELHWAIRDPSSAEILFLLTSSLRCLTICYGGWSSDIRDWNLSQSMLFRTIFDITPRLTHLTLNDLHPALIPACLSNVDVLLELRVVSLHEDASIDLDVLRKLSAMDSLEEVSFAVDLNEPVDFSGFSALKKLEMTAMSGSADSARSFLAAFSSPGLRQLTLRIQMGLNLDEISATCTLFAQRFPSLEDLTWSFYIHHAEPLELETALAPLFPLHITKLELELLGSPFMQPVLTDGLFAAFASAWPRLATLYVVVGDERTDLYALASMKTTTHALLALARACPDLRMLRIPRMQGPRPEDVRGHPVLRHGLRTFIVDRPGATEEGEYAAYALLLDRLFPGLDLDVDFKKLKGYSHFAWKRVLGGVQLCRLARANLEV